MAMKKRAIFYSILSILFVSLAVFALITYSSANRLRSQMYVVETRVYAMNDLSSDIEDDLGREMYISGYRALSAVVNYVVTSGTFVADTQNSFEEAFMNGTVENSSSALMADSTFPDWLARIQSIGDKLNVDISMKLSNLTIYHVAPFQVNVSADVELNLTDPEVANWSRRLKISRTIAIDGFEDPVYVVNTYGKMTNRLNSTIYESRYTKGSGASFNPVNLSMHANNSLYAQNVNAPSYLMRIENNLGASQFGIESMVNINALKEHGITAKQKTVIDYIYFSDSSPASYKVKKMPAWFMIDISRSAKYMVTGETY
jgi:hypothetical protein